MKTLFWILLVFGCAILVPAQERVMDKTEFDAIVTGGYDHKVKWKGEKYRMTVTTSSTVAGRPQTDHSSRNLTEFGSSMETRSIYSTVFGGKPSAPQESMRIGNWSYTRSGNDKWTRKEYVPSSATTKEREESRRKIFSSQAEYKYLGQSTLMDRPAHIYVKTERQTTLNEKSGESAEIESKNTYWVDANGTILKSEFRSETRGKNTMQTSVIMEWELDTSITFIVPEIVP
jgi:hypothetical protein